MIDPRKSLILTYKVLPLEEVNELIKARYGDALFGTFYRYGDYKENMSGSVLMIFKRKETLKP